MRRLVLRLNSMAAKMPAGPPPTITTSCLLLIPVSEPDSTSRAIPCQTRSIRNEADDRPRSITFLPEKGYFRVIPEPQARVYYSYRMLVGRLGRGMRIIDLQGLSVIALQRYHAALSG